MTTRDGTLIGGRYRVLRRIGSGAMAAVYLAEDERLRREVAIKRLHADSPEEAARRFDREARLGASLNHPNVVSVYDVVTEDEDVLIVMEYVKGWTLASAMARGTLQRERALEVLAGVAAALDHAHDHGVIHRDIKPANVLLRTDGFAKLADLGIATAAHATQITGADSLLGTPAYMAPEQLAGEEVTAAADIYALAAVAYEVLSGQRARQGATPVEIAHKIVTEPPPDLRGAWPEAPASVALALQSGMARDPAERPRSARVLVRALEVAARIPDSAAAIRPEPPAAVISAAEAATAAAQPAAPVEVEPAPPADAEPVSGVTEALPPVPEPGPEPGVTEPLGPVEPPPAWRGSPAPPPVRRAPIRPGAPTRTPGRGRGAGAWLLVTALLIALLVGGGLLVLSGAWDPIGAGDARQRSERPAQSADTTPTEPRTGTTTPSQPRTDKAPTPAPADPDTTSQEKAPADVPDDPAAGRRLNDDGFRLAQQGNHAAAVPVLQRAVASFPEDSTDINYAFSLYNLGRSLRLTGRPEEAIPLLERRLRFNNQRGTVQRELDAARQAAGRG